ncbi:hypothetical protein RAF69_26810, partial [Klebsiella pneumoniae]
KRAYCLKTQPATGETYPKSDLFNKASSALHVASGYDIPTTCIFTAINPVLRSRYYKNCKSIYIGDEITQNLHESEDPAIIEHVVSRFEAFYEKI